MKIKYLSGNILQSGKGLFHLEYRKPHFVSYKTVVMKYKMVYTHDSQLYYII